MSESRVTVVGLGHALLGDDALGLAVVRAFESTYAPSPAVTVLDAGTCGLDLAGYLLDCERLIFVDALVDPAPAGTVRTVPHEELLTWRPVGPRIAPHEPAIQDAVALLTLAGRGPSEALLVGVVPDSMEVGVELSPAVSAAVPRALEEVVRHLERFGVELSKRGGAGPRGVRIEVTGVVQGVGFRPWIHRTARRLGLRGSVVNAANGVRVEAFGAEDAIDALVRSFAVDPPVAARIGTLRAVAIDGPAPLDFSIGPSEVAELHRPSIPADLALCDTCRREIDDPSDRRFGYAFTHCTDCGPRHSIVTGLPYDRARTSMEPFAPCADCAREYADPADRRFHAQAIACPSCGPRLWVESPFGSTLAGVDPLAEASRRLSDGQIVAVQGLGGFHLACDATSERAVELLRARKQRDDKPFAVMVSSVVAAEAIAELDAAARTALTSAPHPIVLVRARPSDLAPNVAPGSQRLGVFLPHTPLHHLLLRRVGRPIVLTSGNRSGEPIALTRDDAARTLADVADAFLFHDRAIVRRVEDSVVIARPRETQVLRRARGFAPRAITLPLSAPEPILAVGAHLKNTACLVVGDRAYLTSHLGDLESYEAERAFAAEIEAFERLLGVRPRIVAHDLHPDYASTRYALGRVGCRAVGVQHHHAHVLAAVAACGIEQPVVGAVFDGSGFGSDATLWGGEILEVNGLRWKRPFSVRPLPLAGGERAVREVWRAAWALLLDAFGPEAEALAPSLRLFANVSGDARGVVSRMLSAGVNVTRARGIGRYFDAFGALCLGRTRARFEGQVAMAWEEAAQAGAYSPYPFGMPSVPASGLEVGPESELDFRPTTRAIVADLLGGEDGAVLAARFHATLIEATARMLELTAGADTPIVLSGGCFQNQRLKDGLRERLKSFEVIVPSEIPVNDGGIALGQAWAAVLSLRSGGA